MIHGEHARPCVKEGTALDTAPQANPVAASSHAVASWCRRHFNCNLFREMSVVRNSWPFGCVRWAIRSWPKPSCPMCLEASSSNSSLRNSLTLLHEYLPRSAALGRQPFPADVFLPTALPTEMGGGWSPSPAERPSLSIHPPTAHGRMPDNRQSARHGRAYTLSFFLCISNAK